MLKRTRLSSFWFTLFGLLALCPLAPAQDGGSDVYIKNLTNSENISEMNARFMGDGSNVVFLEFVGDPADPAPWDYRLMLMDRNGHSIMPLTGAGVVEYALLPEQLQVLVLTASHYDCGDALEVNFYTDIHDWQITRVNITTLTADVVTVSGGRPLAAGLEILGMTALPDWEQEYLHTRSPGGVRELVVRREVDSAGAKIAYYRSDAGALRGKIMETAAYITHAHFNWMPPVVWLDDNRFLTQIHTPQDSDIFSIVLVDLQLEARQQLYRSANLKPFAALALDDARALLYFQEIDETGRTHLCRLNLQSGIADLIYDTDAELGEVRSSPDGTSLLLTRYQKDDCDIIRLDLERNRLRRMASN